jgi:hypothetical protein
MNCLWCLPEPKVTEFHFKNGTTVRDLTLEGAIDRMRTIDTRYFWATEIEPGSYEVQFESVEDPFLIVNVPALDGLEAAAQARVIIKRDLRERA